MKQISAEVIADSINEQGNRITSFVVTFPRFILAEFNTHRMFSRNSASSRAIPFKRMLEMVKTDPFIPIAFQKDHSGMQGTEYFEGMAGEGMCQEDWLSARDSAVEAAERLANIGVTKQLVNRLLEPFMWHTVIVTATQYENFFHLRCPQYQGQSEALIRDGIQGYWRSRKEVTEYFNSVQDVDPELAIPKLPSSEVEWLQLNKGGAEIHAARLAECMWDAYNESTPKSLKAGEWHIPFGENIDSKRLHEVVNSNTSNTVDMRLQFGDSSFTTAKVKIATARCARVSYMNYEGKDDYEADIKLYDRLSSAGHWSPFEHCAQAMAGPEISGNFQGFLQLRKTFANENVV